MLILAGKPGRGKTHLAIAMAYRAIQNGFDAFFTTAAALIDDLSAAFRAGELVQALPTCAHPAVLVVDEVGGPTEQAARLVARRSRTTHRDLRRVIQDSDEEKRRSSLIARSRDRANIERSPRFTRYFPDTSPILHPIARSRDEPGTT